jgi:glycosyltransferase involved in cell wall biosynthesis
MKVLYVHHSGTGGGAVYSLLYLMEAVRPLGVEPVVATPLYFGDAAKFFGSRGFEVHAVRFTNFAHTTVGWYDLGTLGGWHTLAVWLASLRTGRRGLSLLCRRVRPDVVHFNSITMAPFAASTARLGVPNVLHVRERVVDGYFGLRRKFLRRCLVRHVRRCIGICRDNLDYLRLPPGLGLLVHNPVDFSKFDFRIDADRARAALGIAPHRPTVLFASGSDPFAKGIAEFLHSCLMLQRTRRDLVALVPKFEMSRDRRFHRRISPTTERTVAEMLAEIRSLGALHEFEFTEDFPPVIAAADIVCVTHVLPHFSRVVIEAGAMKRPVVGFDVAGVNEVLINGLNGLSAPPRDVPKLCSAIMTVLEDKALARRLGEAGYDLALRRFSPGAAGALVAQVYREVIA